ncbi:hypothetical protein BGW37DRAFT_462886 [Umbelopsis sp. PMI_123]|nr:hypothetical protein BGW37DRAFT_462886 [Umbelopsis sp. PMI_123]
MFELAHSLDAGEIEKANHAFNEAKAVNASQLETDWPILTSETTSRCHDLQFSLHLHLAQMYLLQHNSHICNSMLNIAIEHISESTQAQQANKIKDALIWCKDNLSKVEDKALAFGQILSSSIRVQNAKLYDRVFRYVIAFNGTEAENGIFGSGRRKTLLRYLYECWYKQKTQFINFNSAYLDAMSHSRLTDSNVNMTIMLIKGLDVLIERNYSNVGRSLSKENFERIYIIKLHMVGVSSKDDPNAIKEILDLVCEGIQLIKNDLENATMCSICMAKIYCTAALFFQYAYDLYDGHKSGETNLNIIRRRLALCYYQNQHWDLAEEILQKKLLRDPFDKEALDVLLIISVLYAKNEIGEASVYLQDLPNSKGYKSSMSKAITNMKKELADS